MIALSSKNEKRRFNLAYCEIKKAERAEVQRNWHYSPRSTAWASEGERSHAGLKVFETRCQGAILYASLAENVLSGDKNRRYVSRNLRAGRTLLSPLYVCPGRN